MSSRLAALFLLLPMTAPAAEPPRHGLTISMELAKPGPFHSGEIIEVEIRFSMDESEDNRSPRRDYWFHGFLLDPAVACGTLDKPCQYLAMQGGGVNGDFVSAYPSDQRIVLNRHIPPLPSGSYRATMLFRLHDSNPQRLVASPAIEFEVIEADPEWLGETISEAARVFRENPPEKYGSSEMRRPAAATLRFLQHPLAWETALKLYDGSYSGRNLLRGLQESTDPSAACAMMRSRLDEPDQVLDYTLAESLSRICANAEMPFPKELIGPSPEKEKRRTAWALEWNAHRRQVEKDVMARAAKRADIRSEIGVLAYGESLRWGSWKPFDLPEFVPVVATRVLNKLADLDQETQRKILDEHWPLLNSEAAIPALEQILDTAPDNRDYISVRQLALRRLLEAAPEKGTERFLDELRHFRPTLDRETTALVPREAVPPMDDELLDYLARYERNEVSGGADPEMLIARYLSPDSRERARHIHELQFGGCHPEMLAYFVRAYPEYTRLLLHLAPKDMHTDPPPCLDDYLRLTTLYAWNPALEEYAKAYLWHGNGDIKGVCATSLRWYGSASAEEDPWKAFRYFHDWWKDKPDDLHINHGGPAHLEMTLRDALVRGIGWLLKPDELRTIESLCISPQCRGETLQDIRRWEEPLHLTVMPGYEGLPRGEIVQYQNIRGLEMIERKLAQFPRDTQIQLAIRGRFSQRQQAAIASRLSHFAASHGVHLVTGGAPPNL